ncbi:MAG: porin family protein [Bacteroidota bacterium]
MKKKLSVALAAFMVMGASIVHAQKSSLIVRGGINLANVSTTDNGRVEDAKMLPSFQVGLIGDLNLNSFLAIQPGIIFSGKGTKSQSGSTDDASYFRATTNPYYIEVPVNLVFKAPLGEGVKLFVGAGPYAAMGIAGKNKTEGKLFGASFSSEKSIEWSNDDPTTSEEENTGFGIMRRFDYGVNGTAGIELSNVVISANYGLGLAKLQSGSNSSANDNNKNRVLSFTLGFKF